jgi:arabinogalactan oligomer/maltooligosaccharide transport system permease protein
MRAMGFFACARDAVRALPASLSLRLLRVVLVLSTLATWSRPALAADDGHVTLWHAYRGDEERALVEVTRAYERSHPGVTVELLAIPFDAYASKLSSSVPHAHGPDLFIEAHERLGSYLREGIVAPAGDAVTDADAADYDEVALRAVSAGGVRYAVPLGSKCLALFVNEAFFPETPATLEELVGARSRLPEGVYPLAYDTTSAFFHAPFLHAFGGAMLDAEDRFAFHGPEAARSLVFVRGLLVAKDIPEEPSGALITQLFASGHAAAVINGPWFVGDLDPAIRYRVEPLPRIAAAGGAFMRPFLTVEGVFLTPGGAARAEAIAFARHLGGVASAVVRARTGHQVVARVSAWRSPEMEDTADPRLVTVRAFHDAVATAIPMPTSSAMRAAWVPANQAILKVLRGDATPETALLEARHRYEDVTRPPPAPASPLPVLLLGGLLLLCLAFFAVRRARDPGFRRAVKRSIPAYRYVAHAALAVTVLVVLPLTAGALTSLFTGTRDEARFVGLANYASILGARGGALLGHGSFYLTLLVTVLWTVVNVALHLAIGLALGVALSRPLLRMRAVYRVLLILPWAVPSYVTALAWKGMFHRQFGAVNALVRAVGGEPVSWFSHFSTAFAANVATNVWLGFPFMMVVVLGALTSIPKDVLEAAEVDGATRWQRFRLVTLPLLGPALLPAVVLGAVWTFNMFNVVFLVSGGEPDGTTDILVSEAYRWAFTRDAQYGYAAAYAVLIFLLLAGGSRLFARGAGQEAA